MARYVYFLDLSGNVRKSEDDIYVGMILVNEKFKTAFREKFYREFPSLKSFRKKGAVLRPDKLKKIIEFIDKNNIRMTCVRIKRHIIEDSRLNLIRKLKEIKKIKGDINIKLFEDKLIGLVYFKGLEHYSEDKHPYECLSCMESQFDLQAAFVALDRISYKNGYHFRPACTPRRIEHMIKFADFVASAGRKLDKFILDSFTNYTLIEVKPTDYELDVIFGLSRREKTKRKI